MALRIKRRPAYLSTLAGYLARGVNGQSEQGDQIRRSLGKFSRI